MSVRWRDELRVEVGKPVGMATPVMLHVGIENGLNPVRWHGLGKLMVPTDWVAPFLSVVRFGLRAIGGTLTMIRTTDEAAS